MKEYFQTHNETIKKGVKYEFWKIPSGGIVRWNDSHKYLKGVYPTIRNGVVMGGLYERDINGRNVYDVRMVEVLTKLETYVKLGKEFINDTQTVTTHIFRYDTCNNELIGHWVENNDVTVAECKDQWLYKAEYLGNINNGDYFLTITNRILI